jgi:hypothetical protein
MQKIDQSSDKNAFDAIIREKLAHYLPLLNNGVWEEIEKRLNEKPRKKILWPWISGAAAIAALVAGIFSYNSKIIEHGTTEQLSGHETQVTEEIPDEKNLSAVLSSDHRHQRIAYLREAGRKIVETESVSEFDVIESQELAADSFIVDSPVAEATAAGEPAPQKELSNRLPPFHSDTPVYVPPSKTKTSLAFHIGAGGAFMAMNDRPSSNFAFFSDTGAAEPLLNGQPPLQLDVFKEEYFSEIEHYSPLSFGLTFMWELNSRFAFESGLVYTFMASRFENKYPDKSAALQLHYLGVPLNLHTNIIGNRRNKWELYLSTGLMPEKGLWAHYSQREYFSVENIFVVKNNAFTQKIDGWQWSLNAALGIEYKLTAKYGIYLEPRVSYYLKNSQPESARTRNPLIIGIDAGIRYNW